MDPQNEWAHMNPSAAPRENFAATQRRVTVSNALFNQNTLPTSLEKHLSSFRVAATCRLNAIMFGKQCAVTDSSYLPLRKRVKVASFNV